MRDRKRSTLGWCEDCSMHTVPSYFNDKICPKHKADRIIKEAYESIRD